MLQSLCFATHVYFYSVKAIRIRIRNSFIALVFANKECAFVQLVHNYFLPFK